MSAYSPVEDHNGDKVTLHNLCYLIYQAFGQYAVHNFIDDNNPDGVVWSMCQPCETFSPIYENACLVCATEQDN